jgi:hypothetical protein
MSKRILVNGLVGGAVLFVWGAFSHMVLPLGEAGMKAIPNEDAVIAVMRDNMKETAVYLFPGFDHSATMTDEQTQAFYRKWEQGPTGFLVYHPDGLPALSPLQLIGELAANIISAMIAAYLLAQALGTLTTFGSRALFVFVLGFIPTFVVDASHTIWYGFPVDFTLAAMVDQAVGFGLAGLAMAWMLKRSGA